MTTALDLVKRFESCRLKAYPDPMSPRAKHRRATGQDDPALDATPWTIGWGCTGAGISEGITWNQVQADRELETRLALVQHGLRRALRVPVSQDQFAALSSLAWNAGLGGIHRVLEKLNAGEVFAAAEEFTTITHAHGEVVPGLVKRRSYEVAVFLSDEITQPGGST